MNSHIIIIILFSFLVSCASSHLNTQNEVKSLFRLGKASEALSLIEKSSLAKEENDKALYLLEKGMAYFKSGYYSQAANSFQQAINKNRSLETKSIRESIGKGVTGVYNGQFKPQPFEISSAYYFLAQSFVRLSQAEIEKKSVSGTEDSFNLSSGQRRDYLLSARAALLDWDSYLKKHNRNHPKTIYKRDLLQLVFAGQVHESIGSKIDSEIALKLFEEAYKSLGKQLIFYSSFNQSYKDHTSNILESLSSGKKSSRRIKSKKTDQTLRLTKYLRENIARLAYKIRKSQLSKFKKLYKISKPKKTNVTIFINDDFVGEKHDETISFNLNWAIDRIENPSIRSLVKGIGVPILTYFATGTLGLGYYRVNNHLYMRSNLSTELVKNLGIEFKIPMVRPSNHQHYGIRVVDVNGKSVVEKKVTLISSQTDIASASSQEEVVSDMKSRGVRLGIKYIVAIAAAYTTYQTLKEKKTPLASTIAMAQYFATTKLLAATDRPDIRFWSSMPAATYSIDLNLRKGSYQVFKTYMGTQVLLGDLKVDSSNRSVFTY